MGDGAQGSAGKNEPQAWEERTKPEHAAPFWKSFRAWWYHRWKLNGFIWYRAIVGYGEYPFNVIWAALAVVLGFMLVYFILGTSAAGSPRDNSPRLGSRTYLAAR